MAYKEPRRGGKLRGPEVGFSNDRPGADARAEWPSGREGAVVTSSYAAMSQRVRAEDSGGGR